ncbi:amidase [uncultured Trichococcus sp.]|uniref:amidase n=1 Tax=uncultured Trichococcus sp. TaxID=189665 RepID=UPI0029C7DAAA|nr:amidase [uncultured Trichococcus sp.]
MDRQKDAWYYADLLHKRKASPAELLEDAFAKIAKENPHYNAVVHTRKEKALQEAKSRDYSNTLFGGVPILIKDLGQDLAGEPATSGSRLLKGYRATKTSHFVEAIERAGFIVIGQTNTPEFGFKNITDATIHGPSRNPFDKERSPGGSSGGAAAAVASGMVPIATASDGGGSIRIPASFTGLVGLKPTRGRVPVGPGSYRGWQGASVSFALTKSVRDTALLLDALQTEQAEAPFQTPLFRGSHYQEFQIRKKRTFKIAYSLESPVRSKVSEDAKKAVLEAVSALEALGYQVEEAKPEIDGIRLMEAYYAMNGAETDAMLTGIANNLGRTLTADDMELISWSLYQYGKTISGGEYSLALGSWDQAAAVMARFHESYDLFLQPTTAESAPRIDHSFQTHKLKERMLAAERLSAAERKQVVWEMFEDSLAVTPFTQQANLTGQPAISLPLYRTATGLPIGVQFTAPKGKEEWLLDMAGVLERNGLFR